MSLKTWVMSRGAEAMVSRRGQALARRLREDRRLYNRWPVTLDYFHQADDPYSHICLQLLSRFVERYQVVIKPWLVPAPDDAAAPERERLRHYALRDARRLAAAMGLDFSWAELPPADRVRRAESALSEAIDKPEFLHRARYISKTMWDGDDLEMMRFAEVDADPVLAAGAAKRQELGHYLSGMTHFGGEWYWGADRLAFLEERLTGIGADRAPDTPPLCPRREPLLGPVPAGRAAPAIELFFSFRSPYSWLVMPRIRQLAAHYGAPLELRYILPMVMRGLPVPKAKRMYIMLDCKREADRLDLPFGRAVDPVGAGVERALAVLQHAIPMGKGAEFAELALRGAFADGIALAEDKGLMDIASRAGLSRDDVTAALANESWRAIAEANRDALFEAGLWGPPSFRIRGGETYWGQDRLWMLEDDLRAAMGQP
jgi:2-hydroxychromene-2-carboxylate isomerase